jgi:hypothetical protein
MRKKDGNSVTSVGRVRLRPTDTMISRVLAKVNYPASSFLRPAGKGTIDDRHCWHSKLG